MLDIQFIKKNLEETIFRLKKKKEDIEPLINKVINLDEKRISFQKKSNSIQEKINENSKKIGELFKSNNLDEVENFKIYGSKLKEELKIISEKEKKVKQELNFYCINIPNIPNSSVPNGKSEKDNLIEKTENKSFLENYNYLPHWELCQKYNLIDFKKGTEISGSGFPLYKDKGAIIQRSLINFFIDFNTKGGYEEYIPPLLVNEQSALGTGNLPDKDGQMYHVEKDNLYLIPTSEVPLTNIFRNEIINPKKLPIKITAYTPCFRREAGSYGKNVRGLNRLHQFDKVEIVQITHPDESYKQLEKMINHVEKLLIELELPYRLVKLCGGDLSFSSAITYDFEVYSIAQKKWLEVSSISNFETFQAKRCNIKFKLNNEINFCHTLNGSSLALPRILAAILENNQSDKGIQLPKALKKYTGFEVIN